jgi:ActR/RegA family two-component response regulator
VISPATKEAVLAGLSILVVEDDYYQATDTKRALERAGARVIGPSARPEEALGLIDRESPDCAVIDLNLGDGPSFVTAYRLVERNIPLLIVSGYDDIALPKDLLGVPRLEKPVDVADLVDALHAVMRGGGVIARRRPR